MAFFDITNILLLCDRIYENPEFQDFINQKYDLVIMNGFINNCFDGVIYKIGAPHILITTMAAPTFITEFTGNYLPSSFVPIPFFDFSDNMSFKDRLLNGLINWLLRGIFEVYGRGKYEGSYRKHLGQDIPGIQEIHRNVSLLFMNSHFSLTYPRPNLPDNVEVGGMHCRPAKPLPKVIIYIKLKFIKQH